MAVGLTYTICTYQARGASEGHFNPAITIAAVASRATDMSILEFISYIVAQLVGGVAGALAVRSFARFAPYVSDNDDTFRALIGELILVFVLATVVLNVRYPRRQAQNSFFGIAIGFAYAVATYALFFLSRAGFNAAVIGLAAVDGSGTVGDDVFIYLVTPVAGVLAAFAFIYTSIASPLPKKA